MIYFYLEFNTLVTLLHWSLDLIYLASVPRSAEFSNEGPEPGEEGGAVADWKVEQYRNNKA